ncbi:MAG: type IV toxin-antitoxin system AbiEi family antitoxin domain-containing protein [Acetatifactor sp.]|nr:type IV toxin-antitoxin system AbiEi family antitoxin domain-containing protein [Acetatifactor sp.]
MTDSKQILELAKQNNGVITTAMVVNAGFSRGSLKYLSDMGRLECSSRGVYTLPEVIEDEFVNFQTRYKKGIYSLGTALFLCDLTDRTPLKFHMVFPATYNLSNPKKDSIVCSGSKEPLYSLGVTELPTPGGNMVRSYCAERTLCDILRPRNHVDMQVVTDAYKRYVARKDKNIPLLSEYAKAVHVEEKLRSYLEVLL